MEEERNESKKGSWRDTMYKAFGVVDEDGKPAPDGSDGRWGRMVGFFNSNVKEDSTFSWGLVLLLVFALYATVRLVMVILYFF